MAFAAFGVILDIAKTKEPRTDHAPTNILWMKRVLARTHPKAANSKGKAKGAKEAKAKAKAEPRAKARGRKERAKARREKAAADTQTQRPQTPNRHGQKRNGRNGMVDPTPTLTHNRKSLRKTQPDQKQSSLQKKVNGARNTPKSLVRALVVI